MYFWKRGIQIFFLLISVMGLIGCATTPIAPHVEESPIMEAINKSADQIHAELQQLRSIKQQQNQKILAEAKVPDSPTDTILNRKINFRWSGPIAVFVKQVVA
jgi:hypothetical protein